MKYFQLLITAVIYLIVISCTDDQITSELPQPSRQKIEITLTYSGTAKCTDLEKHDIHFALVDQDGITLSVFDYATNPQALAKGKTVTTPYSWDPGIYLLYSFWDWRDNGGQDGYEPIGKPYPAVVEIDGYQTAAVDIEMIDRTNPNDDGWVEGRISYQGSVTGYHHIFVVIQDFDYNIVAQGRVTSSFSPPSLSSPYYYTSPRINPGTYHRVFAWWDIEGDESYDSGDPRGDWVGAFILSPGLPTVGKDIVLE